jgi:hypothetical protein
MQSKVKLIEAHGKFLFITDGPINIGESVITLNEDGSASSITESWNGNSKIESNHKKVLLNSEKIGWIATSSKETPTIKRFIRAELRPKILQGIFENNGNCEIETILSMENESNRIESDVVIPYLINNMAVIHV